MVTLDLFAWVLAIQAAEQSLGTGIFSMPGREKGTSVVFQDDGVPLKAKKLKWDPKERNLLMSPSR